jgi:hypothetical protein
MSIVVGYIDTPEGNAALDHAVAEAKLRGERLVVLHSAVGGSGQSPEEALANAEAIAAVEERLRRRASITRHTITCVGTRLPRMSWLRSVTTAEP